MKKRKRRVRRRQVKLTASAALASITLGAGILHADALGVPSGNTDSMLYRFMTDTRRAALDDYESQRNGEFFDQMAAEAAITSEYVAAQNASFREKAVQREAAASKVDVSSSEGADGVPFMTREIAAQKWKIAAEAISCAALRIEDTAVKAEKRMEEEAERAVKYKEQISERLTDKMLAEQALCYSLGSNVPNDDPDCNSANRAYEPYTAITDVSSAQYALLNGEAAYTDEATGIRCVDGRYCIAVGSGYCTKIGTKIDLVMENGDVVKCILGDCKSDLHTDSTHRYSTGGYDRGKYYEGDGSVAEFIVDYQYFNRNTQRNPVNTAIGQYGKIVKVVIMQ